MRTLFLAMLGIAAIGCSTDGTAGPEPADAANPPEVKATEVAQPTEPTKPADATKPDEAKTEAAPQAGTFELKPVPSSVSTFKAYNSGLRAFVSTKRKMTMGMFSGMQIAPLRFQIIEPDAEGGAEKIAIDWNRNKDFTDDGTIEMPAMNKVTTGTVKISDQDTEVSLYKYNYSTGYTLILRPGKWLEGTLEIDGKAVRAALYDLNFNGIDTKGGDIIVVDQNGDGKLGPRGGALEGQAQLTATMILPGGVFDFAYDAEAKTAVLKPSDNVGKVVIKVPEWTNVSIAGQTRVGTGYQQFVAKDGTLVLPAGDYRQIYLNVNAENKEGKLLLRANAGKVTVKKGETTELTIEEPSGVKPKVRIVKNSLKIRESFSFTKAPVGIAPNYSVYAQGKRVPAPKIEVFKGDEKLTQGTMKYG